MHSRTESAGNAPQARAARPGARPEGRPGASAAPENGLGLGRALTIRDVARAIGCSVFVVRYRLVPRGLPHFRSSPNGKYVFYERQVRAWVLAHQQEGGRMHRGSVQAR